MGAFPLLSHSKQFKPELSHVSFEIKQRVEAGKEFIVVLIVIRFVMFLSFGIVFR